MGQSTLLEQLDLTAAIIEELRYSTRLLPASPEQVILRDHIREVESVLKASLQQNNAAEPASVVLASKTKGLRPLNLWRLQDRVLYRALAERLRLKLPAHLQKRVSHDEFTQSPHLNQDNDYIASTDITAYYQYIDHDVLADELIAQTGDFHAVTALTELLQQVMGGRVGIPQVHSSSDVLGDTYIDPIRRKLIRAGYDAYSFADDFRIGCPNLGSARAALELCSTAAHELGLVLNDAKTFTYHRGTYEQALGQRERTAEKLLHNADLTQSATRFLVRNHYTEEEVSVPAEPDFSSLENPLPAQGDVDDINEGTLDAERNTLVREVWRVWTQRPEERRNQTLRELLGQALPVLGKLGEKGPLAEAKKLLDDAPDLTPMVAEYLTNLAVSDPFSEVPVTPTLLGLLTSDRHSDWQKVWLAHTAGTLGTTASDQIVKWLTDRVRDGSPILAAHSAAALGALGRGDATTLKQALNA